MANLLRGVLVFFSVFLVLNTVQGADSPAARADIFKGLQLGQRVTLKEGAFGTEISLLGDGKVGAHIVLELGVNHIVLEDIMHITKTWIPITSIRSVSWMRLPVEPPR